MESKYSSTLEKEDKVMKDLSNIYDALIKGKKDRHASIDSSTLPLLE